jgi:hypothetical protein
MFKPFANNLFHACAVPNPDLGYQEYSNQGILATDPFLDKSSV